MGHRQIQRGHWRGGIATNAHPMIEQMVFYYFWKNKEANTTQQTSLTSIILELALFVLIVIMKKPFSGELQALIDKAQTGSKEDIDIIMSHLTSESSFETTRYVDYALSLVINPDGFEQIKKYLFNGTLIQRNYASLYLNRLGEWEVVKEAFHQGLIDEIQAFARWSPGLLGCTVFATPMQPPSTRWRIRTLLGDG